MASNITLSAGVRQNLLSLQSTAAMMSQTQSRLSTGKKVNSALDNPVNFFTSSSLQSRATDLSSLIDSMSNGIKQLQAADNGITSITSTVQSMQSTLRQARQDKSFKTASYSLELPATPAGTEQLSFSGGAIGTTAVNVDLTSGAATAATYTAGTFAAMDFSASSPTAGTNSFAFAANTTAFGATDEVDITLNVDGGGPVTVTLTQGIVQGVGNNDSTIDDIDEFTDALNAAIGASSLTGDVTATNDGTNVTLTSATTGTSSTVAITAVDGDPDAGNADFGATPFGAAVGAGTAGAAAGAAKTLSFDVAVDGGTATTVTIDAAAVAAVGDNDNVIDDVAELASIVDTQLGTGVTVDGTGTTLALESATTGTTSSIAISNLTATNITNTSGVANTATPVTGAALEAKTVDELVTEINNNTAFKDKIVASSDNGKLRIQNLSTADLTVGGLNTTGTAVTGSTGTNTIGGNDVRKTLVTQFNTLLDQLNKTADDSSFNGINLLRADKLKLVFNEIGTSTLEIQAKDVSGNATSIDAAYLGITTATNEDFGSDATLDSLNETMTTALSTLRAQASSFGSNLSIVQNRQDFTKSMINTLQTGADNLVLADTNEEGANLLALQTRQQLSTTALSLSSQADQAVLRLF